MSKPDNPALKAIAEQRKRTAELLAQQAAEAHMLRSEAICNLNNTLLLRARFLDEEIAAKASAGLTSYEVWRGQAQIAQKKMRDNDKSRSVITQMLNTAWATWPDPSLRDFATVFEKIIASRYAGEVSVVVNDSTTCPDIQLVWKVELPPTEMHPKE